MLKLLQNVSGFFFYLLGASFFLAYLFLHNDVYGTWPAWWMQVADLPLLLSAVTYGGSCFLMSIREKKIPSPLIVIVLLGCGGLFVMGLVMNFWDVHI